MMHFNLMKSAAIVFRAIAAAFTLFSLSSCAVTYQFAPIEAWVVDAETGKPIAGVVVTANWELVKGSLDGPRYYGQLEVKETVTDANGRFAFDGFSMEDSSGAELRESDPQVIVFKAGYEYQRFTNDYRDGGAGMTRQYRTAAVNGKTVKLLSMLSPEANKLKRSSAYFGLDTRIEKLVRDCHWKKIPRTIVAMDAEDRAMRAKGKGTGLIAMHDLESLASKCGAPREFFAGEKK